MTIARIRERAPTWYTLAAGGFLLLQGVSTLLFLLFPPLDRAFPQLLLATRMIPIHSTMHIVTGLLAVAVLRWGGRQGAWWFALLFGIYYTLLGVAGLVTGFQFGLALQPFDHPFHLLAGIPGLLAAAIGYRAAHTSDQSVTGMTQERSAR
jgi:hypothetical protein